MKIGWLSASPGARTGYGTQTLDVCDRLADRHEIICIAQVSDMLVWGGEQEIETPTGKKLQVKPLADIGSAVDIINKYYVPECKLDLVVGFMDAFGIEYLNDVEVPVIGWIPIDGPFTEKWKYYVRDFHKVVAYSHFGYEELQKWLSPSKIGYIPHMIDEAFKPLDKDEIREEFEKIYGVPKDAVLYINVGANVGPRKELPLMMKTFTRFVKKLLKEKEEPPYLFMHTNALQIFPRGYDLPKWRDMLGPEAQSHILFPKYNPIISPVTNTELARINTAGDAYWQNSVAEGFGLPEYEALGTSTAVICPDNSAQTEIIEGNGPRRGWLVECLPEDVYEQIPVYVPQLPNYPVPNQRSALEKLEEAYHSPDLREKYGKAGRAFIEKYHNPGLCMNKWFDLLDKFEAERDLFKELGKAFEARPVVP